MEVSSAKLQIIVNVPKSYIWNRFEAFKETAMEYAFLIAMTERK